MQNFFLCVIAVFLLISCADSAKDVNSKVAVNTKHIERTNEEVSLDLKEANRLLQLPLECIQTPLPYKPGLVVAQESDLAMPIDHHPAFYGCYDWHSAVHGHWSLVYLLKHFPAIDQRQEAFDQLNKHLTKANIAKEVAYFSLNSGTKNFERTYGWAWLLKLQEELYTWDDPQAKIWYEHLKPLERYISDAYCLYLPKLVYPIRTGTHSNTAFGLSLSYDYAVTVGNQRLKEAIEQAAKRFYTKDQGCPITWEPSGYDFLSPCLQEMDIMRKVLSDEAFETWSKAFLPTLEDNSLRLKPGRVLDRADGHLVHLDGLNFSRAWCLFPLKDNNLAYNTAIEHVQYSLPKITDGDYAGQHWLGTFALYAFKMQQQSANK